MASAQANDSSLEEFPVDPSWLDAVHPLRERRAAPIGSEALCRDCGSRDIARDEVEHVGPLQLAECRQCRRRWTWRLTAVRSTMRRVGLRSRAGAALLKT